MNSQECMEKINQLDCEIQHIKYYNEGYREKMLDLIHGEEAVWDKLQIDTDRYSPDSARRISYDNGRDDAARDYDLLSQKS